MRKSQQRLSLYFLKGVIMPFLLIFAFAPAILVIALAVMLISGAITFLTNRGRPNIDNKFGKAVGETFASGVIKGYTEKMKEFKKTQQAKKPKTVEMIDIIILEER